MEHPIKLYYVGSITSGMMSTSTKALSQRAAKETPDARLVQTNLRPWNSSFVTQGIHRFNAGGAEHRNDAGGERDCSEKDRDAGKSERIGGADSVE